MVCGPSCKRAMNFAVLSGAVSCFASDATICLMIASIVLLIGSFLLTEERSAGKCPSVKDYVSCLSIPGRHTLKHSGTASFALLRCGGGDGKRLARGHTKTARRPAVIEPTDPRSRE